VKTYFALIKNDLRLALRGRSVVFFNYLFPLMFFFAFAEFMGGGGSAGIAQVVSMVLVIGIMGNGLWGAGMRLVQEREMNILRRFRVTPISPLPILVASMVTGWLLYIPSLAILLALAHWIYKMPIPENLFSLVALITIGIWAFRALGLIVASVVNGMQESTVLIQVLYMPMLFLSGATIPLTLLPVWAQVAGQFLPASYLITGIQGVFLKHETLAQNLVPAGAMLLAIVIATFISVQLFRWEKEERIAPKARFYVLAVLAPFLLLGVYQAYSRENIVRANEFFREIQRTESFVVRGGKVMPGDGRVIENGGVLVRDGRVERIFEGNGPELGRLDVIDGSGKTLVPGIIAILDTPDAVKGQNKAIKSGVTSVAISETDFLHARETHESGSSGPLPGILLYRSWSKGANGTSGPDLWLVNGIWGEAAAVLKGKKPVAARVGSGAEAEQAYAAGIRILTYQGALPGEVAEFVKSRDMALIPPAGDVRNAMQKAADAVLRASKEFRLTIREGDEANFVMFDPDFSSVSRVVLRGERVRP
jgi:ABC-type multidrug transport system permease subunit